MNELWRINSDYLAAYTEDPHIMRKLKRSYPFPIMAEYESNGFIYARQYLIPNHKKRTMRKMLGVDVSD